MQYQVNQEMPVVLSVHPKIPLQTQRIISNQISNVLESRDKQESAMLIKSSLEAISRGLNWNIILTDEKSWNKRTFNHLKNYIVIHVKGLFVIAWPTRDHNFNSKSKSSDSCESDKMLINFSLEETDQSNEKESGQKESRSANFPESHSDFLDETEMDTKSNNVDEKCKTARKTAHSDFLDETEMDTKSNNVDEKCKTTPRKQTNQSEYLTNKMLKHSENQQMLPSGPPIISNCQLISENLQPMYLKPHYSKQNSTYKVVKKTTYVEEFNYTTPSEISTVNKQETVYDAAVTDQKVNETKTQVVEGKNENSGQEVDTPKVVRTHDRNDIKDESTNAKDKLEMNEPKTLQENQKTSEVKMKRSNEMNEIKIEGIIDGILEQLLLGTKADIIDTAVKKGPDILIEEEKRLATINKLKNTPKDKFISLPFLRSTLGSRKVVFRDIQPEDKTLVTKQASIKLGRLNRLHIAELEENMNKKI